MADRSGQFESIPDKSTFTVFVTPFKSFVESIVSSSILTPHSSYKLIVEVNADCCTAVRGAAAAIFANAANAGTNYRFFIVCCTVDGKLKNSKNIEKN